MNEMMNYEEDVLEEVEMTIASAAVTCCHFMGLGGQMPSLEFTELSQDVGVKLDMEKGELKMNSLYVQPYTESISFLIFEIARQMYLWCVEHNPESTFEEADANTASQAFANFFGAVIFYEQYLDHFVDDDAFAPARIDRCRRNMEEWFRDRSELCNASLAKEGFNVY